MNPSTFFTPGNCKYIYGDPPSPRLRGTGKPEPMHFCERKSVKGLQYCVAHQLEVHQPRKKPKKAPKGVSRLQVLSFREVRVWA